MVFMRDFLERRMRMFPQGKNNWLLLTLILVMLTFVTIQIDFGQKQTKSSVSMQGLQAKADVDSKYNLSSIVVLTRVISYIKNYYYDPARIEAPEMFKSALDEVARSIPSVMVRFDDEQKKVQVNINTESRSFNYADINSIWKIQYRLSAVFRFIQPHLGDSIDPKDVEFAAINGMLDTLDPHSVHMSTRFYRELKLSTQGNFGGLGIQIGIREGTLTIIVPIMDTPAWRAGLKAKDSIVKIDGQSTVNMNLDEAVQLMRGERGTKVVVSILRKGWPESRDYTIIRDIIPIRSVYSKLLPNNIAYAQVTNFQSNTVKDLKKQLDEMKEQGPLTGLILDLRGNPGGLLDSAVKMSDLFLDSGVIVTTVGAGNQRLDVNEARFMGVEEKYPIMVLVGSSSASASEIVAGALKNNNRVVVIGERTFGKGSVQVLYDMDDGSALKLTVAQYLTPGDVSIQSVGVVPDITVIPVYIEDGQIEYYSNSHMRREKDLAHHLDHKSTIKDQSFESFHYLYKEKRDEVDMDAPPDKVHTDDFLTQFAYRLLKSVANVSPRREIILQRSVSFLKAEINEQDQEISKKLKSFKIDWNSYKAKSGGVAQIQISYGKSKPKKLSGKTKSKSKTKKSAGKFKPLSKASDLNKPDALKILAGDETTLKLIAKNNGTAPIVRLRAITKSDNPYLDGLEFFFGRVNRGKSKSWSAKITIPKNYLERSDDVVFTFFDEGGNAPDKIVKRVDIKALKKPEFAYTYQISEKIGNGDNLIQKGETIDLLLNVTNIGSGDVLEGMAMMKNTDNLKAVFINSGRDKFDNLEIGKSVLLKFCFEVKQDLELTMFPMELVIMDSTLRKYLTDKVRFHVFSDAGKFAKTETGQIVKLPAGSVIYGSPDQRTPKLSKIGNKEISLPLVATKGNWAKVKLGDKRFGWVLSDQPWKSSTGKSNAKIKITTELIVPTININELAATLYTDQDKIKLEGMISDNNHIQDAYILCNNKKVFFTNNLNSKNPLKMSFSAVIPLDEGSNPITIFARETEDFVGQKTIFVYRKKSDKPEEEDK